MKCLCPHCSGEINLSIFLNKKTSKKELEPIELQLIAEIVCSNAGITLEEFKSPKRDRVIAKPRQQYMWLASKNTELSKSQVGTFIRPDMNHSTVIHGIKVIDDLIESSSMDRLEMQYLFDQVAGVLNTNVKAS
jgi:chromosomal replication initiation ATPase DnaA